MRKTVIITACAMLCQCLWGEPDSTHAARPDAGVKINRGFLKALDHTFSLSPEASELPSGSELTREQLHQWVGKPDAVSPDTVPGASGAGKFTREYFAYKCYLKEYCIPLRDTIRIPVTGLPTANPLSTGNWDFNHGLSMLLSKKYRQRVKSQRLAASHRQEMDLLFPLAEGEEIREADTGDRSTWEAPDWLKGL